MLKTTECKLINKSTKGTDKILFGIKNKKYYYINIPRFNCNWYWGALSYSIFENNRTTSNNYDLIHVDSLAKDNKLNTPNDYMNYFDRIVLTEKGLWEFIELTRTYSTLKSYSELLSIGGSHITTNPIKDLLRSSGQDELILTTFIPETLKNLCMLLIDKDSDSMLNIDYINDHLNYEIKHINKVFLKVI